MGEIGDIKETISEINRPMLILSERRKLKKKDVEFALKIGSLDVALLATMLGFGLFARRLAKSGVQFPTFQFPSLPPLPPMPSIGEFLHQEIEIPGEKEFGVAIKVVGEIVKKLFTPPWQW